MKRTKLEETERMKRNRRKRIRDRHGEFTKTHVNKLFLLFPLDPSQYLVKLHNDLHMRVLLLAVNAVSGMKTPTLTVQWLKL